MNFMGIGFLELVVILLVAFLVLGPSRSIGMARTAGQLLGNLKRTFNDVASAASQELGEQATPRGDAAPLDQREEPPSKTGDE